MKTLAILAAVGCASAASAQYASMGDLTFGNTEHGVFPAGFTGGHIIPSSWHLWTFDAIAGDNISISVSRTSAVLDPVSSAFFGDASGAAFAPPNTFILDEIAIMAAIPGLTFAGEGDDNVDDPFGGPFADPQYGFVAQSTGTYSVFVGSYFGLTSGSPEYDITVTGSTAPAPGALALLGMGGLVAARRRR